MGGWRAAAIATEFGFSVGGSLVGGVLLGRYADERLGTSPLFLLLGLCAGFLFSLYLIYVIYRLQIQPRHRNGAGPARGPEAGRPITGPPEERP